MGPKDLSIRKEPAMAEHDQRMKSVCKEFLPEFFDLYLPDL